MTPELEISIDGALGRIALNRPLAVNALSLDMIQSILDFLHAWQHDRRIGAVLFTGNGPKGFCAGGDVRVARELVLDGRAGEADDYFAAEYRMNVLIASYPKPIVALTHGVTMGGGLGIAGHCGIRLTQPGARFAMPESAIGFFADVGVNAILSKAPLNRALLFLLSGVSVGAADAVALGLVDAIVRPETTMNLCQDIAGAARSVRPRPAIVRLVEAESVVAGEAKFCGLADRLPDAPAESPAEFLSRVAADPALSEIAALLETRCPASLTASFFAQLAARGRSVQEVLDMDLRLAGAMARRPDFAEGVRAVLVDKDQRPRWTPATLDQFGAEDVRPLLEAVEGR